ncbi:MAG: BlaI/MecI/CopY family transcriptional regulator [Roseburia sp.]|nr:BlaI/MecI/CopY family transcriptional regulator [Roseburia sp.]
MNWKGREKQVILTPCEALIMRCVWRPDVGELFTAEEIIEKVREVWHKNWTTTNGTAFLDRLKRKGLVGRKRRGFRKYYYCRMTMEEAREAGIKERTNGWF